MIRLIAECKEEIVSDWRLKVENLVDSILKGEISAIIAFTYYKYEVGIAEILMLQFINYKEGCPIFYFRTAFINVLLMVNLLSRFYE